MSALSQSVNNNFYHRKAKTMKKITLLISLFLILNATHAYTEGFISVKDSPATPVANTLYKENMIDAWVVFDGTSCSGCGGSDCTIHDSFNIEKVTRTSTGLYEVYWNVDFTTANYLVSGTATGSYIELGTRNTNKVEIAVNYHGNGSRNNVNPVSILAIGTQ